MSKTPEKKDIIQELQEVRCTVPNAAYDFSERISDTLSLPREFESLFFEHLFLHEASLQGRINQKIHVINRINGHNTDLPEVRQFLATTEGNRLSRVTTYLSETSIQALVMHLFLDLRTGKGVIHLEPYNLTDKIIEYTKRIITSLGDVGIIPSREMKYGLRGKIAEYVQIWFGEAREHEFGCTIDRQGGLIQVDHISEPHDFERLFTGFEDFFPTIFGYIDKSTERTGRLPSGFTREHAHLLFIAYTSFLKSLLTDATNTEVQSLIKNKDREQMLTYLQQRYPG